MIKFAIKVGLASSAVYYVKEQGVWRNSVEAEQTYNNLKDTIKPYVDQVKAQIPVELPEMPASDGITTSIKQYWNGIIMCTFHHISKSPQHFENWTNKGVSMLKENPEMKNFIDSFSSKPEDEKTVKKSK